MYTLYIDDKLFFILNISHLIVRFSFFSRFLCKKVEIPGKMYSMIDSIFERSGFMQYKWDFTPTSGQIKGIADGAIAQFDGKIITSLARENCQNSLDAVAGDEPVFVKIEKFDVDHSLIPGYDDYLRMLKKSYDYWKDNEKNAKSIRKAINSLEQVRVPVLIISDFNTKGLKGPYSGNPMDPWGRITITDGGSAADGNTGGSYGIGKNAPYAASDIRMVFYRTYNQQNERAAQGLSRFVSFELPDGHMSSGYGYFGDDNIKPIDFIPELDRLRGRVEVGSDVFIFGFNGDDDWQHDIIEALLVNFMVSIFENKIVIDVDGIEISKDTLPDLMEEYAKDKKGELNKCYSNYMVLTSDKTVTFTKEFHGLGYLELKILIDSNLNLDKNILRTRKTGMKLFHRGKVSKVIPYSAILRLCGDSLGKYFLELEPPTHDAWDMDRASNKAEAKEFRKEIEEWEKTEILKLGANTTEGDVAVEGLSENLAMSGANDSNNRIDALSITIDDLKIVKSQSTKVSGKFISNNGEQPNKSKPERVSGRIDDEKGKLSGIRTLKGEKIRKKREKHKAVEDPDGLDIFNRPQESGEKRELESLRVIKTGNGKYELIFVLNKNVSSGHIAVLCIGENNRSRKVIVSNAKAISNIEVSSIQNGDIYFNNIATSSKVKLAFELDEKRNFAMEVEVYEH